MTTINKATNDTLKEIAMFLKALPSAPGANSDVQKQAKALTKALTQARANIKEVGDYAKEAYNKSITTHAPEEKPAAVPMTPRESSEAHGTEIPGLEPGTIASQIPDTVVGQAVGYGIPDAGKLTLKIDNEGTIGGVSLEHADYVSGTSIQAEPMPLYETACFVNPEQFNSTSAFIGRKPTSEGNFTMELYKKV